MSGKKYLVTGGQGKLGSNIKDYIPSVALKKEQMNILNINQIEDFVKEGGFYAILHLATVRNQKYLRTIKVLH